MDLRHLLDLYSRYFNPNRRHVRMLKRPIVPVCGRRRVWVWIVSWLEKDSVSIIRQFIDENYCDISLNSWWLILLICIRWILSLFIWGLSIDFTSYNIPGNFTKVISQNSQIVFLSIKGEPHNSYTRISSIIDFVSEILSLLLTPLLPMNFFYLTHSFLNL